MVAKFFNIQKQAQTCICRNGRVDASVADWHGREHAMRDKDLR
jgi:hypothetical protein